MSKTNVHMNLDTALHDAIRRYAAGHGLNFTAAVSVLAARGLRDEGITIQEGDNDELRLHQERTGPVDRWLLPAGRQLGTGKRPRQPVRGC